MPWTACAPGSPLRVPGDERHAPIAASVQWVALVYGATALVALVAIELAFADPGWRIYTALGCLALLGIALWLVRQRAGARRRGGAGGDLLVPARVRRRHDRRRFALRAVGLRARHLLGRAPARPARGVRGRRRSRPLVGPIFGGLQLRSGLPSTSPAPAFSYGLWLMQAAIFLSTAALVSITLMYAQALARARAAQRAALPRARRQHPGRHHRVRLAGPLRLREPRRSCAAAA